MPLEDILRKIRDESSRAARDIIEDAEARARKRLEEAKAEARGKASLILEGAKAEATKAESMAKARADATLRQLVLKEKQALIDSVFAKAAEALASIPAEEYRAMMLRSVAEAAEGNEIVVFGPEDQGRLGAGFAGDLNREISAKGKPGSVKVRYAEKSLGGGYLLQSGGVSLNATFPALMKRFADELEIEVARKLFSE